MFKTQDPACQDAFLTAFARTCAVTRAEKESGIDHWHHYNWLRTDPDYARRFNEILTRPGFRTQPQQVAERKKERQETFLAALERGRESWQAEQETGIATITWRSYWLSEPGFRKRYREIVKPRQMSLLKRMQADHLATMKGHA